MPLYIRPGKVTCAGLVVIMMVLPNNIWKGPDAKDAPAVKAPSTKEKVDRSGSAVWLKLRKVAR